MVEPLTDEEQAQLDALLDRRAGLLHEKARRSGMGTPTHAIDNELGQLRLLIKPLNVRLQRRRQLDEHEDKINGNTHSQLMKMCSLVTGLVKRGVKLTPAELERYKVIATSINHTKAVAWFAEKETTND